MCAKGNPKLSSVLLHLNDNPFMEQSDSREKLFDSSLKTVNVSVNTELPMDFSYGPKGEVSDNLHFYGEMDDDDSHGMMSVDNHTFNFIQ